MSLTVQDAADRRVVRMPDGRTARLVSVPAQSSRRSKGAKARVVMPGGHHVSVPVGDLTLCVEPVRPFQHSMVLLPRVRG